MVFEWYHKGMEVSGGGGGSRQAQVNEERHRAVTISLLTWNLIPIANMIAIRVQQQIISNHIAGWRQSENALSLRFTNDGYH